MKKTKLFCKTFLHSGQCKNPDACPGINHWNQEKVDQAKSLYGEDFRLFYNPPKHKPQA